MYIHVSERKNIRTFIYLLKLLKLLPNVNVLPPLSPFKPAAPPLPPPPKLFIPPKARFLVVVAPLPRVPNDEGPLLPLLLERELEVVADFPKPILAVVLPPAGDTLNEKPVGADPNVAAGKVPNFMGVLGDPIGTVLCSSSVSSKLLLLFVESAEVMENKLLATDLGATDVSIAAKLLEEGVKPLPTPPPPMVNDPVLPPKLIPLVLLAKPELPPRLVEDGRKYLDTPFASIHF